MDRINDSKTIAERLESYRIIPTDDVKVPPVAIMINSESGSTPSFTLGNFSMVIGKAKSKKTFLIGALAAAAITGSKIINVVEGKLPENKRKVLYFDTEQSKYHATRTIQRIARLSNIENPENLLAYGLRSCKPETRCEIIENAINLHSDVGLVIIDGGRDLLSLGINDEKQATEMTSNFLRWTEDKELHLIIVLHQNKNDTNARGHFGTECINKAETTASVSVNPGENTISVVTCEFSREEAFSDFAFKINPEGLPEGCDLPNGSSNRNSIRNPSGQSDTFHLELLQEIFDGRLSFGYHELFSAIKSFTNTGDNSVKTYLKYYLSKGWLKKPRKGYYVLSFGLD
jgi:hypothetical protein